jgi:hypothetical protein
MSNELPLDYEHGAKNSEHCEATITTKRHLGSMSIGVRVWVRSMWTKVKVIERCHCNMEQYADGREKRDSKGDSCLCTSRLWPFRHDNFIVSVLRLSRKA